MSIEIDFNDAIMALSDALDLVGIDEVAHGKRVGYMAFKCAEKLGLDKPGRERFFQMGLVHDCGVSSSEVHRHLITELQWQHDEVHSITGERLLRQSRLLAGFASVIRHHHTPWSELQALPELSAQHKFEANLLFLVDRVDALAAPHYNIDLHLHLDRIRDRVVELTGRLFSAEATTCFLEASSCDSFWLMLEPPHLERFIGDMRRFSERVNISGGDVMSIARVFAQVVDAKSTFTFEHSIGVASLARFLASQLGIADEDRLDEIEIAGLLHDLGKLRIPDEILENRAKLSSNEILTMHRHSFETFQILRSIRGFEEIALWASYHHERPNGSGYPFQRQGEELSLEARIIAVADVFQALAQKRPYRDAMRLDKIASILQGMAQDYMLDRQVVDMAIANLSECHHNAVNLTQMRGRAAIKPNNRDRLIASQAETLV